MNIKHKPIIFVGLSFLVGSLVLLSACSGSSSQDSRIAKLETGVQANTDAIAKLQQQVAALTPAPPPTVVTTPPPATPTVPTTPPASTTPAKPTGVLASTSVILGNLAITPAQVNIGGTVTMSISVSNNSTSEGKYKVVLTEQMVAPQVARDVLEYANLISLKAGETQTVTFTATKSVAGTYSVQAGSKVSQYTVVDPNAAQ